MEKEWKGIEVEKIRFKGEDLILVGDATTGAITTEARFCAGVVSIAYLLTNGDILAFGEKIGTKKDIQFQGKTHVVIGHPLEAMVNILGWSKEFTW